MDIYWKSTKKWVPDQYKTFGSYLQLNLILYFSPLASQCHWFRVNPLRNDQAMVKWSFGEQREKEGKTVKGILQIASRDLSILFPLLLNIVVLVLAVILMGGSSNSDQNWVRYDSLKLAIQNWKSVYEVFYITLTVRPVVSQYCPNSSPNYYWIVSLVFLFDFSLVSSNSVKKRRIYAF